MENDEKEKNITDYNELLAKYNKLNDDFTIAINENEKLKKQNDELIGYNQKLVLQVVNSFENKKEKDEKDESNDDLELEKINEKIKLYNEQMKK